jgi:hypothetical protein
MSQHMFKTIDSEGQILEVLMGYDRRLNYVFCVVTREDEEVLYSNLDDDNAGTQQQDVDYYRPVLEDLGLRVPEPMFQEIKADQADRVGNRTVVYEANE